MAGMQKVERAGHHYADHPANASIYGPEKPSLFGHAKCTPRFLQSSQRDRTVLQDGQANDVPPIEQSRPQLMQFFITQNTLFFYSRARFFSFR